MLGHLSSKSIHVLLGDILIKNSAPQIYKTKRRLQFNPGYLLKMTSVQLLFIILVLFHGIESIDPIVEIPGQGMIQGIKMTTLGGKTIHGFLGVPYAKPPVGDLRFLEPQPPEPFIGVWNASHFRPQCLQYRHILPPGHDKVYGDEDCLYANIYTPEIPMSGEKKFHDVIINFHGGAFMFGSGEFYGPKYLLDRDVILVSINYRLGPLGFLSLEDEIAPGNNGMKDQVAAMKWTKDNIAVFGGNPNSVHMIGLSAGGASVHLHYLSPLSKGLFKSGISMSGTALCPWALVEKPKEKALKLAAIVGCPTNINSYELLKCLRHRPAADLVSAMSHFQIWLYNPFSPFGPVVEPKNVKDKAFLPDDPFILLSNGKVQNLPWMTGVTSHEGLYPASDWVADDDLMDQFSSHFEDLIPHILHFNDTAAEEELKQISNKIRKFYFGNKVIGKGDREEVIKVRVGLQCRHLKLTTQL
ncbi:hypothetical protein J437_LFUL018574 [Ladona fulva]|uniref:Carboxylesterase type B domain-containing protein n=1 Tax=Ladona fulva TaxID=123851 RepID=A0A8K0KPN4_LADFU|nr:hypothetical protein J437_LFUL018574 [Ladona fulva]